MEICEGYADGVTVKTKGDSFWRGLKILPTVSKVFITIELVTLRIKTNKPREIVPLNSSFASKTFNFLLDAGTRVAGFRSVQFAIFT